MQNNIRQRIFHSSLTKNLIFSRASLSLFKPRQFSSLNFQQNYRHNENQVIQQPANRYSDTFQQYYQQNYQICNQFKDKVQNAIKGGKGKQVERHLSRGKLMTRDRVSRLIDEGQCTKQFTIINPRSPFLQFNQLAAYQMYPAQAPSAGIVTGIGKINGHLCVVIANDATVRAGTYCPMTMKKQIRAQKIAKQNNLPCIYLIDSGGVNLNMADGVFPDSGHFGSIFYNMAQLSARNIPQVSVAFGGCTAGGAYQISMVDQNVIVNKNGFSFLGGPPLVKAATGEIISADQLGGARLHCQTSGVTDHFAVNQKHALQIVRDIVSNLNPKSYYQENSKNWIPSQEPLYPADDIYGILSPSIKNPFSMRQLIAHIFDGSKFHDFKPMFGSTLVTGFARLYGHQVGILGNDGVLYSESSQKGAHFVQLCSQRGIPVIFLQNITGFMIGSKAQAQGISKHGAKLVSAVSNCRSPKITLITGASYGAGNYGMCGRGFEPKFLWMLPISKISVMGGDQAAGIFTQIQQQSLSRAGKLMTPEEQEEFKMKKRQEFERKSTAEYSTARMWDDGVIMPHQIRRVLGLSLIATLNAKIDDNKSTGVFRM